MVIDCEFFFLKIFQGHQWFLVDFFENCYTKCSKLCFLFLKKVYEVRDLMVQHLSSCVTWRCWRELPFPLHPSSSHCCHFHFDHTAVSALPLSKEFLILLLASKVNVELSKRLKFSVKGFKTISKGFSILLEKFGCGCTQQSWRQWNKGEQIFHLFCL